MQWRIDGKYEQTHVVDGWRMRSEICLESWWELRTIMLCNVAGCWGMLITIAPTLKTAALLVLSPRWALYKACDLAMLHFTTVLKHRGDTMTNQTAIWDSFFSPSYDENISVDVKQWSTMQIHFSGYRWALRTVTIWMNRNDFAQQMN